MVIAPHRLITACLAIWLGSIGAAQQTTVAEVIAATVVGTIIALTVFGVLTTSKDT